ncbi:MAG: STAS domain-containing protein [Gemmatimonadetes bacterium]|nr:STAS domain-containing protein [Gemmatimonadota bacterium]
MPVFSRVRDGVLVLTVDGDYTANELRRVGFGAFEAEGMPKKVPVLLDLSGAAGLAKKSAQDIAATGAIFGAYRDRLTGIAVVASADVHGLFDGKGSFGSEAGVKVKPCLSHAEARDWLLKG